MFDSPFDVCPVCRQVVLLDQTQAQCAREHGCPGAGACSLEPYFTGVACIAIARKGGKSATRRRTGGVP